MGTGAKVKMTGDDADLTRSITKLEAKVLKLEGGFKKVGRAGQSAGKKSESAFKAAGSELTRMGKGIVGIGAAVGLLKGTYDVWLANTREISAATRKASQDLIAFAALQAGGVKRERALEGIALGARFGIGAGPSLDVIQALQSAPGGTFESGKAGAETVFRASLVGVPVEAGKELAVLGATQGQATGQALRRAFVAGQASSRDPATLALAAAGVGFFDDKDFGFAAAAQIAGSVKVGEVNTFTKAAGVGLSKGSSEGFQKTLAELGVVDATRLEKLRALRGAGIDTAEKLKLAGLGEIRQQQSISSLVQNLPNVERILGEIKEKATPGLFARQRAAIEAEFPEAKLAAEISRGEAESIANKSLGPRAIQAEKEDLIQLRGGKRLRGAGREQFFFKDLIDDTGRSTPTSQGFAMFEAFLNIIKNLPGIRLPGGRPSEASVRDDLTIIIEGFKDQGERMENAAVALEQTNALLRSGNPAQEPDPVAVVNEE